MDWLRSSIFGLRTRRKLVKSVREIRGWHVKVAAEVGQCREIKIDNYSCILKEIMRGMNRSLQIWLKSSFMKRLC